MADVRLRIEVNPNAETETLGTIVNKVNETGTNSNVVNTSFKANSSGEFSLPSERVSGINGLSMASDDNSDAYDFIFNDNDELDNVDGNGAIVENEENPSEFIWGIVPSDKKYSVILTFTNATALKDIVIYGDTVVGQFPTKAIIDGKTTIYSDDAKWAINMKTESDTHTIEFVEWNRANYNACLSNIRVMLRYFDLDKGWIDSVESLTQTTSDPSSIQYGVLANSGTANLRDLDGELKDLIIDEVIPNSNVPVELFVNGNKIQSHITTDSDYDGQDKMLSVSFQNSINKFDEQYLGSHFYISDNINAYLMMRKFLKEEIGISFEQVDSAFSTKIIYGNDNVFDTARSYLENIKIPKQYLFNSTKREAVNKFCSLGQICLIKDENDNFKVVSSRPIAHYSEINNAIKIPKSYMINNINESIVVKNKYNNVKLFINKITETTKTIGAENIVYYTISKSSPTSTDLSISDVFLSQENPYYETSSIVIDPSNNNEYKRTMVSFDITDTFMSMKNLLNNSKLIVNKQMTDIGWTPSDNKTWEVSTSEKSNMTRDYGGNQIVSTDNSIIKLRTDLFSKSGGSTVISEYGTRTSSELKLFVVCSNQEFKEYLHNDNTKIFEIENNELIQEDAKYKDSINIYKIICENIIGDYANGVSNAQVDVFCGDMFNSSGIKVKNWANGDIINPYDIVYFDGDTKPDGTQRYWRVTGRTFKYAGSPTVSLELQEIAKIYENN